MGFWKLVDLLWAIWKAAEAAYLKFERWNYEEHYKKIEEDAKKAGEGNLEDRLKAGERVEDNYNRHT